LRYLPEEGRDPRIRVQVQWDILWKASHDRGASVSDTIDEI